MPVEIKEIIIRAIVEEGKNGPSPSSNNYYAGLLNDSAAQVLKIIEKKKER